jgi:uncharacterized membrane protein
MKLHRGETLSLVLVGAAFLLSAILYARLPDRIPSHWNARGEIDSFVSKPVGPFLGALVMSAVFLIFLVLPAVSPRGFRFERFRPAWGILEAAILGLLLFIHTLALMAAMGKAVDMKRGAEAGIGLLIAVLGNFLGKVSRNFFIGIRTPWTLASEEVWLRTHRLAGKLFLIAGLAMFVLALAGAGEAAILSTVAAAGLISVVASYVFYRRIEGFGGEVDR